MDTGANKNYIRTEHVQRSRSIVKPMNVQTVNGVFKVDKFALFNPFPQSKFVSKSEFYIFDFSPFFDGLLGYEFLQKSNAIIDAAKNQLIFPDLPITMKRKFPESKRIDLNAHETKFVHVAVKQSDGDFLLSREHEIARLVYVNPGIYRIHKGTALVEISNLSSDKVSICTPQINTELNNFDTASSFETVHIREELFSKMRLDHLNAEEREVILKVVANNQNCFYLESEKLTFTNAIKHKIETTNDIPVHTKSYRYPHCHKAEVQEQIKKMLDQNIIRPSTSPWSSPVWVVPKKPDASGKRKWRLVIDYRKVNEKTIDDRYPMPNITDILDKLGKCNYFTTLDLTSGFHQIEIHKADIKKTAFSVENGHYEYTRMPFGLKGGPATFQRVMDYVLQDLIGKRCLVYMDDIIIFSTSLQEHAENLDKVLKALTKFNMKIQLDKSEFLKRETAFLGHIVTPEGVKCNPDKIRAIESWPLPRNEKELRGFLGTIGYYRRFIRDFAKIVKPLTVQLKKNEELRHTKEFVETFEKCKSLLTCSDILQYPDFSKPFLLTTDASNFALGAVLSQGAIGKDKPIAFASRTLSKSEENYSTIEKELLAIVWACKYFRPYLFGNKFTLYTDHKPLQYIFNLKDPSSKLVRWRLCLEEFDYDIQYRSGKQNVVADGLSRIKCELNELNSTQTSSNENVSLKNNADDDLETVHSANTDDSYFINMTEKAINLFSNQIIFEINKNELTDVDQIFPKVLRITAKKPDFSKDDILNIFRSHLDYKKMNCILCPEALIPKIQEVYKTFFGRNKNLKIVISQLLLHDATTLEEQNDLVAKVHDRAHRGMNENHAVLAKICFFPEMKTKIRKFINLCTECKTAKYDRKPYKITFAATPIPKKPLDIIHVDIFISSPNTFLSAVDKLSRFGILIPIKSRSIPDIRRGLLKLFSTYGHAKLIVSDNEPALKSVEIKGLLQSLDIEAYYTPVNRSEVNGIVERFHSTIAEIFRCIRSRHDDLNVKELFRLAVSLYNSTIHSVTKMKPVEVFYGIKDGEERPLNLDLILENRNKVFDEVILELEKRQKEMLESKNKNREPEPCLEENEIVFLTRQGIPNKTKNKFVEVKVLEDKTKTFIDDKNRKLHKANLRRKPKC